MQVYVIAFLAFAVAFGAEVEKVVETTVTKTTSAAATSAAAAAAATDVVAEEAEVRHHAASPVFVPYPVHYRTVQVPVAVPVDDFGARFVSGNAGVNLGPIG